MAYTTINKGSDYFNTVLYTGNGSTQSITGVGFQPDWVWIKERDDTPDHKLYDVVRGATKGIESNTTEVESTNADTLTSFDSDGFSLGTVGSVNGSGDLFVSWNWLGGGTASSNTDGSITTSVSANTTSGFSIVTWSGTSANATIGHGLSSAPKMIIIKNIDDTYDWVVYNKNIGNTGFLRLNTINATDTGINMFQNTDPTSSFFYVSSHGAVNGSGNDYVAYCFADVKGYSKFGSYTGNGSTDGTFVYTGFKPAFVMIKLYNTTVDNWYIQDSKRLGYNFQNPELRPNSSNVENLPGYADMLSNGFKLRDNGDGNNGSGYGYIYMAFAENPFVGSDGTPTTAR